MELFSQALSEKVTLMNGQWQTERNALKEGNLTVIGSQGKLPAGQGTWPEIRGITKTRMREEPAALVTSSTSLLLTTLFYSTVLFTRPLCDGSSALFGTIGTYSGCMICWLHPKGLASLSKQCGKARDNEALFLAYYILHPHFSDKTCFCHLFVFLFFIFLVVVMFQTWRYKLNETWYLLSWIMLMHNHIIALYTSTTALAGWSGDIHVSVHSAGCLECLLCARDTEMNEEHNPPIRTSVSSTGDDLHTQFSAVTTKMEPEVTELVERRHCGEPLLNSFLLSGK